MKKKYRILSTKKLSTEQKQRFLSGLKVIEKEMIDIKFIPFTLPNDRTDAVIFTSQNAVKSVFSQTSVLKNDILCVGEKTAELITHLFQKKPLLTASSSKALAKKIVLTPYRKLLYFTNNLRRDELPVILSSENRILKEVIVYETRLKYVRFSEAFDGVLFFSPSAVDSYLKYNSFSQNTAIFALGNTTENVLRKKEFSPITASEPTTESLIQAVNHYFQPIINQIVNK